MNEAFVPESLRNAPRTFPLFEHSQGMEGPTCCLVGGRDRYDDIASPVPRLSVQWSSRMVLEGTSGSVHFHDWVRVGVLSHDEQFACSLPAVLKRTFGPTKEKAVDRMVTWLRTETSRLLGTLVHRLSRDERRRKEALLGLVDVVASELLKGVRPYAWVFGRVEKDSEGGFHFHALGAWEATIR